MRFLREGSLRILQVSTQDIGGGAEKVARYLFEAYRERGHQAWLAVGRRNGHDPDVVPLESDAHRGWWARLCIFVGNRLSPHVKGLRGAWRLPDWLRQLGQPRRFLDIQRGLEDFDFPATLRLLDLPPDPPQVVHCHNLHGGYFDLRVLPRFSHRLPLVMTLHDAWLLSGHCAHSFGCERWKTGCGACPDLTIGPAIHRDATACNWRRKREIFSGCRLYVATPSQWLMAKVEQSILASAIVEARVIPYGVDLTTFHPTDRHAVRTTLGIPKDARVLLFSANGIRRNIWKDYQTMRTAVSLVSERMDGQNIVFFALGEDAPMEHIGRAEIRFVPFKKDPEAVARYYQAADVYVHAARADTFPNTVLEALACGTPVVATAVGGIPEQVKSLRDVQSGMPNGKHEIDRYEIEQATGMLVPVGDAEGMARSIARLLTDERLLQELSRNAAEDARRRFDLNREVGSYLSWYEEMIAANNKYTLAGQTAL